MSEETYNPTKTPLTARETELLVIGMQCMEVGDIKINYEKFTKMANYNTKKSACNFLGGLIKHKIASSTIDNFSIAHGTGEALASPNKRAPPKAKATASDHQDNAGGEEEVVKKSPKKRAAPKSKAAASEDQDCDGDAVKKSPKKRAKKSAAAINDKAEENEDAGKEAEGDENIVKQEEGGESFFEAAVGGNGEDVEV
ncbi:MAG: hypothetical protein Q9168_004381 [Polycauliona sp. 1 TL-2023]